MPITVATGRSLQSRLWTPSDLKASASLWLDATDLKTITLNGATVSQWNDKSGQGNHVLQGTSTNQPAYTATFPGHLTFTRSSSHFLAATAQNGLATGSSPSTLYCVATATSYSSIYNGVCFGYGSNATNQLRGLFSIATTGYVSVWEYGSGDLTTTSPWPATINVVAGVYTSSSIAAYLNGTKIGSESITSNTGTTFPIFVGAQPPSGSASNFWNGNIYEIIIMNGIFNSVLDAKITGYLAWKYGVNSLLPANHQYALHPPRVAV